MADDLAPSDVLRNLALDIHATLPKDASSPYGTQGGLGAKAFPFELLIPLIERAIQLVLQRCNLSAEAITRTSAARTRFAVEAASDAAWDAICERTGFLFRLFNRNTCRRVHEDLTGRLLDGAATHPAKVASAVAAVRDL